MHAKPMSPNTTWGRVVLWFVLNKLLSHTKKSPGAAPRTPLLHPSLDEYPRRPGPPAEAQIIWFITGGPL